MLKNKSWFLWLALVIVACSSGSDESNKKINYATLDSLQTEVVLEIGESEDFIAGRLGNLQVMDDGTMLVGDFSNVAIEQFDAKGNHIGTIATEGDGPGEITPYFAIKNAGNDSLLVLVNQMTQQRDYFARGEDGLFQLARSIAPNDKPEQRIRIVGPQSDSTYYTISGYHIKNIQEALKNSTDYRDIILEITNHSFNTIRDSVHLLKVPNTHFVRLDGGIRGLTIPFRFQDLFVLLEGGKYIVARPDSCHLNFYNNEQQLQRKLALNVKSRPVTSADLDYELGDIDRGPRNEIEARVSENKPPYLNIWATNKYLWLHTSSSEQGKEMVVLDYEGRPLGKFMLPEVDDIQQVSENYIYTIHRSPTKGDLIRVYEVNI